MTKYLKTLTRREALLASGAAVAAVAVSGASLAAFDNGEAPVTSTLLDDVQPDGVRIGQTKTFKFKNVIDLVSDRRNLSVSSHVQLPPGYVIEEANFDVHRKKHTVTYSLKVDQPNSVSIAQSSLLDISRAADSAMGMFSGKKKLKAAGEIKRSAETLRHSVAVDATSHARVSYKGWADGRRYSSRDGVIVASLIVKARRASTSAEVNAELASIANTMLDANATIMQGAAKSLKAVQKATKSAAKAKKV